MVGGLWGVSSIANLPCGSCSTCTKALTVHKSIEREHETEQDLAASCLGHHVKGQGRAFLNHFNQFGTIGSLTILINLESTATAWN